MLYCRGWEQLEVTCNPHGKDRNNLWNVEGNTHDHCEWPCHYNILLASEASNLVVPCA